MVFMVRGIVHVKKVSILTPQEGLEFPRGRRFCKTKIFKEICEALLEFPEGCGVFEKISSVGKVWIFAGTTHCSLACMHEDNGVAQDGGYTTANRLMETCNLGL